MKQKDIKPEHIKRFWSRVKKTKSCWEWIGKSTTGRNHTGYGVIVVAAKQIKTHIFSWVLHNGDLSPYTGRSTKYKNQLVLHKCDNPKCVRPKHLFLGTQRDNVLDKIKKNRHIDYSGDKSTTAKLSWDDVRTIRKTFNTKTITKKQLGVMYKVTPENIGRIIRAETWKE
jgi:hypothetical protein